MVTCVHSEAAAKSFLTPSLYSSGMRRRFPYQSVQFIEADVEA